MLKSIEGILRNGKVELFEAPPGVDGTRVVVTFLEPSDIADLSRLGIDEAQAADLRGPFNILRAGLGSSGNGCLR